MAVLAIHDLSCYSKSSLTVVLPVLEALGVETAVLPTAILSTQTDGFDGIFIEDQHEAMKEVLRRFSDLGLRFDGVYSGFLGSLDEIDTVIEAMSDPDSISFVDPVMGDNGTLYQTFDSTLCSAMLRLVRKADIITPNFTEAMLLTGLDDGFRPQGMRTIRDQVSVLRSLGPSKGVITGIPLEAGGLGNAAWDDDEVRIFQYEDAGISYPGSGDLFASLLFGLSIKGGSFFGSAKHATDIATYAVSSSRKSGRERKLGIMLQPVMDEIRRRML